MYNGGLYISSFVLKKRYAKKEKYIYLHSNEKIDIVRKIKEFISIHYEAKDNEKNKKIFSIEK